MKPNYTVVDQIFLANLAELTSFLFSGVSAMPSMSKTASFSSTAANA